MASRTTDYLIIGNSAAGVSAAEAIRRVDAEGSITIVGDEPHAAYGRPLISYLVEGKTTEDRMRFREDGFYERMGIQTLLGPSCEAVSLDAESHAVELKDGTRISYETCLVATGSAPFVPPIEGLDGKSNVHAFLTLDDALGAWREALEASERAHAEGRASRALVIGAGLIGLKAAEALSHHVDDVVVLELAPRILPAVLDERGAQVLAGFLFKHGITCMPGVSVGRLLGEGDRVDGAVLTNGDGLSCDFVVTAVGVRPNSALAVAAGAEQGRGLVCGADMRTSLPDVYAAGDVTQVVDLLDGSQRPLALWPNAVRQGRTAGLFMAGSPEAEPFEGNFAVNAVDFFDSSLLTAGLINPPDDGGFDVQVAADGDSYAKFVTKDDRLFGYILLNRPTNAGIYTAVIEQGTPLSSLSADLFADAPANMDFPADVRWERLHTCYPSDRDERGWKERA